MGNAVPKAIKARAKILLKEFPKGLGTDFEKNKAFIEELNLSFYKTTRNKIAGFISRQTKKSGEK